MPQLAAARRTRRLTPSLPPLAPPPRTPAGERRPRAGDYKRAREARRPTPPAIRLRYVHHELAPPSLAERTDATFFFLYMCFLFDFQVFDFVSHIDSVKILK